MSSKPSSASPPVGNLADLAAGQVLLPEFVEQRNGRVWINPELLINADALIQFIDRLFSAGACLVDIDYPVLCELMYPRLPVGAPRPPLDTRPRPIASDIRAISPERQALYKAVKIADGGGHAEYVFEPVQIERIVEVPIYGEADADGNRPVTGMQQQTESEPAQLDIDEFVAMMWQTGLRSGLDVEQIRTVISASGVQRMDIARRIDATPGVDATLAEQTKSLHRDDSPRLRPDGRIDLCQFKNRFPQVTAGERLLKKIPRQFGQLGFELTGRSLEPPSPRDYNLADVAGPGTVVEKRADGEYVIAVRDGFLNIDTQSGMISITDKIISREGVSLRTTGDLSLAGEEFEEHGEVQERRAVEGKHMTFFADVFGTINSSGGRVVLKSNLAGGNIHDSGGEVTIEGRASQSNIEARGGSVNIGYAEGSVIVAEKVRIGRALLCTVVAEEVEIEDAVGCAIACRRATIKRSGERKGVDTLVSMAVPDFSAIDRALAELHKTVDELNARRAKKMAEASALAETPELKGYLGIQTRVRSGALKLNAAQEDQLRLAAQKISRPLNQLRSLHTEAKAIAEQIAAEEEEIRATEAKREATGADVGCKVEAVSGATTVCSIALPPGAGIYSAATPTELKTLLRDPKIIRKSLFRNDHGQFAWTFSSPSAKDS